jgi:sugar phosphate isomerase/epimerase
MKIRFFCPLWGSDQIDFRLFLDKVRESGYDGVEMSLPEDDEKKAEVTGLLKENGLDLIAQHWETLTPVYEKHREEFSRRLINLATARPLFINSQTGKDYFSFAQNAGLISIAEHVEQEYGIRVIHETHRGKFSFAPHITADYLRKIPDLKLGLDLSHWCTVAESWLEDQDEVVGLAADRAFHIHSRVGFPEGPQVTDPRIPEWKHALDRHTEWWMGVIEKRLRDGWEKFTITSEFGPYPYMTLLPSTGEPVADQWAINVFMKDYLKERIREAYPDGAVEV